MKKIILAFICLLKLSVFAHSIDHDHHELRHWFLPKENKHIDGSFSMYKDGKVYIEDAHEHVAGFPLNSLSRADQQYALEREKSIEALNSNATTHEHQHANSGWIFMEYGAMLLLLLLLGYCLLKMTTIRQRKYLVPVLSVGLLMSLYGFTKKMLTTTNPEDINAAFTPFIPNVATSWDNDYFYVESKGVPNHTMMVGISNHGWQQQVPIPQCYIGNNHWSIPLNPVIATTPIPVDNIHFTRGAIGIAANGVPIFNYHTNTGVDSYLDGQLDNFGGHCGRGDDYHYHIAPLHLYSSGQTTTNLPCAYSFDGFAVYGNVEPDGSPMTTLDANNGHYGVNGIYHYHGTATAPYMIGNFMGQVTEDATHQLIPQATAHPVRNENWTPLSGALITSCVANATNNGYNLSYSLNGTLGYATNFSWNGTAYTFNYITPTGTTTTNYNGFSQCTVPNLSAASFISIEKNMTFYPNPATDILHIDLGNDALEKEVQDIMIFDLKGKLVFKTAKFTPNLDIKKLSTGTYLVKIQLLNSFVTKKIVVK
ncbi:T9SS type A sorting domain-containing protein [Flavobacterium sp.]|uniref:T9SS type A sorting domain-containing protein n=1 Tax=Flavobacterium sp. TaxID=239 RepID=UPI00260A0119|nr:T9SS type A sorting domain-containing protein [Flavobacterium sp.]